MCDCSDPNCNYNSSSSSFQSHSAFNKIVTSIAQPRPQLQPHIQQQQLIQNQQQKQHMQQQQQYYHQHQLHQHLLQQKQHQQQTNFYKEMTKQINFQNKELKNSICQNPSCCPPPSHALQSTPLKQHSICTCTECRCRLPTSPNQIQLNQENKITTGSLIKQCVNVTIEKTLRLNDDRSSESDTGPIAGSAVSLACEYKELIKNGIKIKKQRNTFYNPTESNDDCVIEINDNETARNKAKAMRLNKKKRHFERFDVRSAIENEIDAIPKRKRQESDSNGPLIMASISQPLSSDSNDSRVPTSVVCLAVNGGSNGSDDDIELGEVVQIDKLDKASVELINGNSITITPSPSPSSSYAIVPQPIDLTPVVLSKKMLPVVIPRIHDWLEKCVEFVDRTSLKNRLDLSKTFELILLAWPRLLVSYMIENSFDFCVTKINLEINDEDEYDNETVSAVSSRWPKESDAIQLHNIIIKGHGFNLNQTEYDVLREVILFKEGK